MKHRRLSSRPSLHGRGHTLVEMMIALVLGLVLVGGVFVVFMGSRMSFKTSDNLSQMQDSARIAFALMGREIREASGTGCGNGGRADNGLARRNESVLNAAQSATPAWWSQLGAGIQGFESSQTTPAAVTGAAQGQRLSSTDALQLAGAYGAGFSVDQHDGTANQFTLNTSTSGLTANDVLIACDYRQSTVFNASSVSGNTVSYSTGTSPRGNCGTALAYDVTNVCSTASYQFDPLVSRLTRFGASTWYIGNGSNGRPALYRVFLDGGPEEIAQGVSDMQITYLSDGAVNYVDATDITDWASVSSVRVELTFVSLDAGGATNAVGDTTDAKERRLVKTTTSTIALRNRMP